ncbi:MAG: PIN domain-containing protein [Syntrophobacteraceae bacterium]|nr:PIN domain-containing protein [Syntrophobacteraceae bacterium]
MKGRVFVDTNILIYAHDLDAGAKHEKAAASLEELWEEETGVLSTQVLQEFYVTVTRKIASPLSPLQARSIIENYLVWPIMLNAPETILLASSIEERYRLSFWDSLIVAAARDAGAEKILTEDLTHGQVLDGVLIQNPFAAV